MFVPMFFCFFFLIWRVGLQYMDQRYYACLCNSVKTKLYNGNTVNSVSKISSKHPKASMYCVC